MVNDVQNEENTLKSFLTGRASHNTERNYLICYFSVYFSLLIICSSTYIGSYSLLTNFISDLGVPSRNPATWWLFSIAQIWSGVIFFPHYRYMYYHQSRDFITVNKIAVTLGYIGSIGSVITGLCFEVFPHLIGVIILFSGVYSSIFFNFIIITRKKIKKNSWPKNWSFVLFYIQILLAAIIYYFTQELKNILTPFGFPAELFSVYLWEWLVTISVIIWIIGLFHITQER